MKFSTAFLLALFAFSLIFPLLYANIPPDRDEGVFLLLAREIKDGAVLYKDYVDNKPPGIFFLLIPVVLFAGIDILKIRLVAGLINYLTAVFIFLIGRKLGNEKVGAGAAIIYLVLINGFEYVGFLLKTEMLSNLFICIGIYALLKADEKEWQYLMSGFLIAFATMVRQNTTYILILVAYQIWRENGYAWKKYALVGIGLVIGLLPFFFYLVSNGVLWDMIYYTTYGVSDVRNMNAIGTFSIESMLEGIGITVISILVPLLLLFVGYSTKARMLRRRQINFLLLWFFLATAVGAISPIAYSRILLMIAIPLTILTSAGILEMWREFKELNKGRMQKFSRYVVFVLVGIYILTIAITYSASIQEVRERGSAYITMPTAENIEYLREFFEEEGNDGLEIHIILVEPQIYYMLEAQQSSRFPFISPYGYTHVEEKVFTREITDRIEKERPKYIIWNDKPEFEGDEGINEIMRSQNIVNLFEIIEEGYVEKERHDGLIIYVRKR